MRLSPAFHGKEKFWRVLLFYTPALNAPLLWRMWTTELQYDEYTPSLAERIYLIGVFGLLPVGLSFLSFWLLFINRRDTRAMWKYWLSQILMLPILGLACIWAFVSILALGQVL